MRELQYPCAAWNLCDNGKFTGNPSTDSSRTPNAPSTVSNIMACRDVRRIARSVSFTPLIMIAGGIGLAGVVIAVLATFGIERQPLSTHYRPASPSHDAR